MSVTEDEGRGGGRTWLDRPWGAVPAAVRDLWRYRELLVAFVARDFRVRYKQALLGVGWAFFLPALVVAAGAIVRYAMAQMAGTTVTSSALGGVALKGVAWSFFVSALSSGSDTLVGERALLTKVYFPREVFPVARVTVALVDGLVGFTVALVFVGVTHGPSAGAYFIVGALFVLLAIQVLALSFLTSCLNLFFRDVKYLVRSLLTFGIFFTPVFYESSLLGPFGPWMLGLNPVAPVLEAMHVAMILGESPLQASATWNPTFLLGSAVATAALMALSLPLFRRLQSRFAEVA